MKANKLPGGVNPTRAKLANSTELNFALGEVTNSMKPEEWMYQAATKVNAYSPVITIAVEADVFHVYGRRNSSSRYWQGLSYSTGVIAAA